MLPTHINIHLFHQAHLEGQDVLTAHAHAESYAARVRELQKAGAPVGVRPTTLDAAIKYVKTSQNNPDPFELVPSGEQVTIAESIKSPDTCDICWGKEGVKKKVPVFWVEGLGLASTEVL